MNYRMKASKLREFLLFTSNNKLMVGCRDFGGHVSHDNVHLIVSELRLGSSRANGLEDKHVTCDVGSGLLGCWVDTTQTSIVQAGSMHALITDAASVQGTDSSLDKRMFDVNDDAENLSNAVPIQTRKLQELLSSSLRENVASLGLCLTILVKSPSSYETLNSIRVITDSLGFNLLQVRTVSFLLNIILFL